MDPSRLFLLKTLDDFPLKLEQTLPLLALASQALMSWPLPASPSRVPTTLPLVHYIPATRAFLLFL